jgi:hypothetical protein
MDGLGATRNAEPPPVAEEFGCLEFGGFVGNPGEFSIVHSSDPILANPFGNLLCGPIVNLPRSFDFVGSRERRPHQRPHSEQR